MRFSISAVVLALLPASWAMALTSTTVSFQNGVNSYSGTVDRYIFQNGDGGADGSATPDFTLLGWNGTASPANAQQALIRFDNIFGNNPGQIPLGARIIDASLQLSTIGGLSTSTDATTAAYGVAGLTAPFNSATIFSTYTGGHGAWFEDGHSSRPQGTFGRLDVGETQRQDIRSIVQQWSDQTLTNNGLVVSAGFPGSPTDTWKILTTSNASAGSHPKLSVTYTTDNVQISSFQRDTNGYTAVDSARVSSKCNTNGVSCTGGPTSEVTTNGNTLGSMTLQLADPASAEQLALFKFNDVFGSGAGQAPTDKPVQKAWLVLTTLNSSNTAARIDAPVDAYEMKRAWTTSSLFSDPTAFGANGGLQGGDSDIAQDTLYRTPAVVNDSEIWFDVTDYYERIRNGETNNGIAIQSRSTDGWQFVMNNGSGGNQPLRPRLVVMSDLSPTAPFGDFNNDTNVDAADYVIWQRNGNGPLPNDNGVGNKNDRYTLWRANFGATGSVVAPRPQTLVKYDPSVKNEVVGTTMPNLPASSSPAGITGMTLTRGGGVVAASLTNGFSSNNWTNGGDHDAAVTNGDFYQWGLTLDATHTASLSALDLFLRRSSAAAASNFEVQASLDGFASAGIVVSSFTYMGRADGDTPAPDPSLDTPFYYMTNDLGGRPELTFSPSDPIPQINLTSISQLQNVAAGSTVTFRLYAWGATSDTSTIAFRIYGPKITGTVSAVSGLVAGTVPEPSCLVLATMLGTLLVGRRPMRKYVH